MPMRSILVLAALSATLAGAACTSGSSSKASASAGPERPAFVGPPSRITWTMYKTGTHIGLVNESHSDRLETYSQVRDQAGPKVQSDDIVDALIRFFDDEGFEDYAVAGSAPPAAVGQATQAIEVQVDGRSRFMVWSPDRPQAERDCFETCRMGLMEIWNATYATQAIRNPRGEAVFGAAPSKSR